MVIQNFDVQTSSHRTALSIQSATTQKSQFPEQKDAVQSANDSPIKDNGGSDFTRLLDAHKRMKDDSLDSLFAQRKQTPKCHGRSWSSELGEMPNNPVELKNRLAQYLFELLFGRSIDSSTGIYTSNGSTIMQSQYSESFSMSMSFFGSLAAGGIQGEQFFYESEQVSYQAQGIINTADGKTINVDINMQMSRQFTSYMGINATGNTVLCDPLVINYGGTAASLAGETFMFDLTTDGNMEKLSMLGAGSGFLALDKNGDGVINDGSELFGPNTGCGFSELRAYDYDGNGWIDEADEIFEKLIVWQRNEAGNDTSFTLKELGIGAIFLGNIATEFSFKGESNETLGVMRSTSFFLKEDGGAGTISHIDLAH